MSIAGVAMLSTSLLLVASPASADARPNSSDQTTEIDSKDAVPKAFSTSYAKSLSLEVAVHGVNVVAVCPGYVHTNLHARAGLHHLEQKVPRFLWCSPEDVVEETQRALRRNRVVCVPGRAYRLTRPFLSSRPAQYVWGRLTARTSPRTTSP